MARHRKVSTAGLNFPWKLLPGRTFTGTFGADGVRGEIFGLRGRACRLRWPTTGPHTVLRRWVALSMDAPVLAPSPSAVTSVELVVPLVTHQKKKRIRKSTVSTRLLPGTHLGAEIAARSKAAATAGPHDTADDIANFLFSNRVTEHTQEDYKAGLKLYSDSGGKKRCGWYVDDKEDFRSCARVL